jgi:L-alanine-DL-glutamate epimerase-like enolase superfamily enzyme
MRIARCVSEHYRLPRHVWWPLPLEDRTLTIDLIELITFTVETVGGVVGSGYTYTLGRGGAAVRAMLDQDVGPQLTGRTITSPAALWDPLWMSLQRVGRGGVLSVALGAADVALWDAAAKARDQPLFRYLGPTHERIPAYGSSIDLGYGQDALLATIEEHLTRGIRSVKIKVGRPIEEDLERLAAVRKLIGSGCNLMVDANTGWDLPEAMRRAKLMERFDLMWLEEPIDPDDVVGHAELQAHTSIPIAAGETLFSVNEFATYFRHGSLRYVQADAGRLGGITPWLRVAALAHAAHLPMAPHFLQDLHVHLLCAIPNGFILEHLPLLDAVLEEPLAVAADGTVAPSERPGTGIAFRSDLLDPHRIA